MSLRDKLKEQTTHGTAPDLYGKFGVTTNPFPSSGQTSNNPHQRISADDEVDSRIVAFLRDGKSQVVVIEGTQGVGKTNFLNYFESEIQEALSDREGYYIVRYLADPEASFEGTIRRLFQELGTDHLQTLGSALKTKLSAIELARSQDMRSALQAIARDSSEEDRIGLFMEWLLGLRVLKSHREALGVQFRLDTVESKTSALRDLVVVSSDVGILKGIFLLLDELEKQAGVLGPTAVVRYLSAMRAIIDALPNHLFMMIAVTPDALLRYSSALPAFRSRLQNQISLTPLVKVDEAVELANFYIEVARQQASKHKLGKAGTKDLVSLDQIRDSFEQLHKIAERRGDKGVRQREYLNQLHALAEKTIQNEVSSMA